jgi:hypothetical protein
VVALVELPEQRQFEHQAEHGGPGHPDAQPDPERIGRLRGGSDEVSAHHVQRTVGQVDAVHDAEDERQPGGEQEQHEAELQAVEGLFEDELKHGRQREAWRVGLWFAYRKSGRLSGDVGTRLSGKRVTKQGLRDRGTLIQSLFICHEMAKC